MEFNPLNPATSGYVIAGEVVLTAIVITGPANYNSAVSAGKTKTFAVLNAAGLGVPLLVTGADKAMDEKITSKINEHVRKIEGFSADEFNSLKTKVDAMPQSVVDAIKAEGKNFFQMDPAKQA
jgi:hypothetical protein